MASSSGHTGETGSGLDAVDGAAEVVDHIGQVGDRLRFRILVHGEGQLRVVVPAAGGFEVVAELRDVVLVGDGSQPSMTKSMSPSATAVNAGPASNASTATVKPSSSRTCFVRCAAAKDSSQPLNAPIVMSLFSSDATSASANLRPACSLTSRSRRSLRCRRCRHLHRRRSRRSGTASGEGEDTGRRVRRSAA